jgi:hypothetical protein
MTRLQPNSESSRGVSGVWVWSLLHRAKKTADVSVYVALEVIEKTIAQMHDRDMFRMTDIRSFFGEFWRKLDVPHETLPYADALCDEAKTPTTPQFLSVLQELKELVADKHKDTFWRDILDDRLGPIL